MPSTLFLLMVGGYCAGALGALLRRRGPIARALAAGPAMFGAAAGLILALSVLGTGAPLALMLPSVLTVGGGVALKLDRDHRLVGEGLEQRYLSVGEGFDAGPPYHDHPEDGIVPEHRHGEDRPVHLFAAVLSLGPSVLGVCEDVVDVHRTT